MQHMLSHRRGAIFCNQQHIPCIVHCLD
jgi:hypothetical protein